MGRKKSEKQKIKQGISKAKNPQKEIQTKRFLPAGLIFGLAFILYANTLGHDYTQDDAIVIYDNMYTQDGISGIPGILSKDTFFGFFKEEGKAMLVQGGRYRPFTLIMFAIEWEFFGRSPFVGHFINMILYGLLGFMIYKLLLVLLSKENFDKVPLMVLLCSLFFIAHPIHTEAVANIKGRDEIMTMLGSIVALWSLLKYDSNQNIKWLILSMISFFIGLMSKENAITFLAVVPLSFFLFRKYSIAKSLAKTIPLIAIAALFLIIRTSILGADFGGTPNELMNNPFLKVVNNTYVDFSFAEKMGTIMLTLLKYLQLLIFPHPLSHDYYPRTFDIVDFSNLSVIASILLHIVLVVMAFLFINKKKIISFGILFYFITISIVSNIVFPIGTTMSERFIFIPSLGFTLILAYLLTYYLNNKNLVVGIAGIILLAFSAKTITRNQVWKDDFTLFTTDVKTNPKSAKLLNAAGGALTTTAAKMQDSPQKTAYLNEAIEYLKNAIIIHPSYRNAYLLLGNAHYYKQDFDNSIKYFDAALKVDPSFQDALKNLPIVLRDGGRHMGQKRNDFVKAESWLTRSYELNPNDYETCRLLGITYGLQNNNQKAVEYFQKAVALKPNIAANYSSLGTAYVNMGLQDKAREAFNKALELDPNALNHLK